MTIKRVRLDNGLTILSEEHHAAPVVALQAWVRVGAADETDAIAGVAHLHEHMLFKGTQKRGVGEIARTVEASGGEINAWTSFDQTVYHVVMARDEMTTGLDILADVLQNAAFDADELAREIEVVCEEIHRAEDSPARRVSKALFELAYSRHPYRRPVLGSEESVRGLTRETILDFYKRYYRPELVTLVAVGDFDDAQLRAEVERLLGDWRIDGEPHRPERAGEPPHEKPSVRILCEKVKEPRIALAWPVPEVKHEDIAALDLLAVLLGHGESSRLYENVLRRRRCVNDIYAYAYTPQDPGLFMLGAGLKTDDLAKALPLMLDEVYRLTRARVRESELEKAKILILSESAYQRETVQGQARKLGFYEVVAGDHHFEEKYRETIRTLDVETLLTVARRYFTGAPAMVLQWPEDGPTAPSEEDLLSAVSHAFARSKEQLRGRRDDSDLGVVKVELENGATLLVQRSDSPVTAIRAATLGGLRAETRDIAGIGHLFASLWGQSTDTLDTTGFARQVAMLGGAVSSFSGRNTLGLRGEFISETAYAGLELFCDALFAGNFAEADFQRERALVLQRIQNREDNPAAVAFDEFAKALYPTHPYGQRAIGELASVGALTLEKVVAHGRRISAAENMVLTVVGNVEPQRVIDLLADRWPEAAANASLPTPDRDAPPEEHRTVRYPLDKQQMQIIVGGMGTTLDDEARYPLEVLTTVLSGQSGRLFVDLRDRLSLAYSISCAALEGIDPGYLLVHMGTTADKLQEGLAGIYGHLQSLIDVPISDDELQRAKRYLIGNHAIDLQRCGSRAMTMALDEQFGLGYDAYRHYDGKIRGITAADVQAVAERFLRRDGLIEVVVG